MKSEFDAAAEMQARAAAIHAERARWGAVLSAPSRSRTHYKPAPEMGRAARFLRATACLVCFAFIGAMLAH